ncbi:hypothetical protein VM1G_11338 [Cytospora mali]|uniref:Uncharacterized protein n=1 Tax=Cytospora mali TaxID=578113 RepID=A0A194VNE2_CYTMA|nr:hypothetical protein VM1G_11338 [Valsa mali]
MAATLASISACSGFLSDQTPHVETSQIKITLVDLSLGSPFVASSSRQHFFNLMKPDTTWLTPLPFELPEVAVVRSLVTGVLLRRPG